MIQVFASFYRGGGPFMNLISLVFFATSFLIFFHILSYLIKNVLHAEIIIFLFIIFIFLIGITAFVFGFAELIPIMSVLPEINKENMFPMFSSGSGMALIPLIYSFITGSIALFFTGIVLFLKDNVKTSLKHFDKYLEKRILSDRYDLFIKENADFYIPRFEKMEQNDEIVSFNWASFFIPHIWFAHRKMYVAAFISMVIVFIPILNIFLLVLGFFGNYLYFIHIKKIVSNPDVLEKDLLRKDGVSVVSSIMIFIIAISIKISSLLLN